MMAVHNEHKFISFPGFSETVSFDDDDFEDDGNNFIISLEESGDEDARQPVVHTPAPVLANQSACHLNNTTQGLENERQLTAHSNFDVQRTNSCSFNAPYVSTFSNSDFLSTTSNNNTTSQQNNMPASVRSVPNENWPNVYNITKEMQWNRVFYSSVSNDNPESTGGFASVSNIGSAISVHNNIVSASRSSSSNAEPTFSAGYTTQVKPQLIHSENHSFKNFENSELGNVGTEKNTLPETHLKTNYSDLLQAYMTTPNTSLFCTNRSPCESIPFHKTEGDLSKVHHVTAEKQNSLLGSHSASNLPACNVPKLSGPYLVNGRKEVGGDSVCSEQNVNSALGNVSEFKIHALGENTECTCIMCYKSSRTTSCKEPAVNETNLTITHPAKKRRIKKSVADGNKKSWLPNVTITSQIIPDVTITSQITPAVPNVTITSQITPAVSNIAITSHIISAVPNIAITSHITPTVPNVAITSHITPAVSNVAITSQAIPVVPNVAVTSQMQAIPSDIRKQAHSLLNGKVSSYEHCSVYPAVQATQHTDILERHGTSLITLSNSARVQETHKMDPHNKHKQTSSVASCDSMNSTQVVPNVNKPYLQCQTLATVMPAVSRIVPVTAPSLGSVFSVYKSQPTKVFLKPAEDSRNKLQSVSYLPVLSPSHQSSASLLHACTTGQEASPIKGTAQISTSNSPVSSPPIYKIIYVSSDQVLVCPSQASSARPVPSASQTAKPNTHQHATFVKLPESCIPASREKSLDTSFVLHHSNKVDLPSSRLLTQKCEPVNVSNTKDTNVHQELRHVLRSAEKIDISRPGEVLIKLKHPLDTGRHRTVINESTQTAAKIIDKIIIPAPMISLLKDFKSPQINNSDSTPSSPIARASVVSNSSQSNTPGNPIQSTTPAKHTVAHRSVEFTQTLMGLIKSHIQEQTPVTGGKTLMNIIKGGLKTQESSMLGATHQDTGGGGNVSRLHESVIQKPKEEEVWCRSDEDEAHTSEVCSPILPREGLPSTYIEDWVQQAKSYSAEHLQDDNFMPDCESQNTTMSSSTTLDTSKLYVKSSTDNDNIHVHIQPQTESATRSSVQKIHDNRETKFINLSELHIQKPNHVQSLELHKATESKTTDSNTLQNLPKHSGLPTTSHTTSGTLQNHVQSAQKSQNEPLKTLSSSTVIADSRGIKLKIKLSELRKKKIKYKGSQKSSDQIVKFQQDKDECHVQKTNSVAQQNQNGGAGETKNAVDNLEHKKRTETAEEMFQRFQDQAVQEVFNAQLGVGYVSRSLRPGRSTMTFLDKYPYSFDTVYPKKKINNENGPQGGTKQTGDTNKCQVLPTEQQNIDINKQKNKRPMEEDSCEETTVKYPKVSIMDYPRLKQDCSITNRKKLICSDILAAHKVYVKFNTFENVHSGRSFLVPFFNIGGRRTQFDVEDMEYISQSVMEFEKEERACARHLLFHAREGQKAAFLRRETQFQAGHINERNYKKFSFILEGFRREAIKHAEVPPEQWKVDNCVDIEIDRAEIYNDAEMEFDDSMNDVSEQQVDKENKIPRRELECEQVNDSDICKNNTDFEISNAQTNQTCTSDNVSNTSAPDDSCAVDYTGELIAQVKQEILDTSYEDEDQTHPQHSSSIHLSSASNSGKDLPDKSVFVKQEPMDDYFDSASATEVCTTSATEVCPTSSALAVSSTKVCSISALAAVYAASSVSSADISKLNPDTNNSMHINNTSSQDSVVSSEKPSSLHIPSHGTCSNKDISTKNRKPSTPDYISTEKSCHGADVDKVLPSANVETDGKTLPAEMASEKRPDSILVATAEIKTVLNSGRLESNLACQTNVECKCDTVDDALSMSSSTEELSSPESPFPSSSLTSESSEISASNDENLQSSESGWTSTSHTSLALPKMAADSEDGANKHNSAQSKITSLVESLKNRLTQDIPSLPAWLSSINPATNMQMKRKKLKTHERKRTKTSEIFNANDKSIPVASTECHTKPSFAKQASTLDHIQSIKQSSGPEFLPTSTPHITQPAQNMPRGPSMPNTAKRSSMLLPVKEPETVQKFSLDHTSALQKDHRYNKDSLLQTDKMRSSVAVPGAGKEIKDAGFESFQTKKKRISEPETLPDICESKMLNKSNISNVEDKELLYAEYKANDDFYSSDQPSPVDLEIDVADQDLPDMASPIDFEVEVGEEDLPEMAMRLQPVLPHIDPYKNSENWTRENSNEGLNSKQTSLQTATVLPSTNTKSLSYMQYMSRKIGHSSCAEKRTWETDNDHQYVLTERKKPMKGPVASYLHQKFSLVDEKSTFKGPRLLHVPASYGNKETSTRNLSSHSQSESISTAELSRTPTIDEIFGAGQRKDSEKEHKNNTSLCHVPAPKQKETSAHQTQVAKKKTSQKKKRRSTVHSATGSELKPAGVKLSISSNLKPNAQPQLSHKDQVSAGPSIQPCKVVLTKLEDMGIVATDRISHHFIFKVQQKYRNRRHFDWQVTEENSNSSFGDRSLETRRKVVKRKRKKLVLGTKRNVVKPKRDIIDYYTAMLKNLQKKALQLEEESRRKAEEDAKRKLEEEIKKKVEENAEERETRENAKENVEETEPNVKVEENAEQKLEEETVGGAEEDTEGETLERAEDVNHSLLEETREHTEDNAKGKSEGETLEKPQETLGEMIETTKENIKAILDLNEDGKKLHEGQNAENKNEEVEINCGESGEEIMKSCVHVAVDTASVDSEHTLNTVSGNENVGQTDWSQEALRCLSPSAEHTRNESTISADFVGIEESVQNAKHPDTNMSLWPDLQKLCDETIFNEEDENIDSAVCFIERNAASTAVFEKKDVVLGSSVTDELFHGRTKSPSEKLHETEDTEEMCSDENDRDQMDEVELLLGLDIHKNTPFSNNDQEGTCRNLPSLDVSSDTILTHSDNTKAGSISGERVCDLNVTNASCPPTCVSENITAIEEKATNIFSSCIAVSQTAATRNLQPHLDEPLVSKSPNTSEQLPPSSFQYLPVQKKNNKVVPPALGENFKFKFKLPAGILSRAIKMSKNKSNTSSEAVQDSSPINSKQTPMSIPQDQNHEASAQQQNSCTENRTDCSILAESVQSVNTSLAAECSETKFTLNPSTLSAIRKVKAEYLHKRKRDGKTRSASMKKAKSPSKDGQNKDSDVHIPNTQEPSVLASVNVDNLYKKLQSSSCMNDHETVISGVFSENIAAGLAVPDSDTTEHQSKSTEVSEKEVSKNSDSKTREIDLQETESSGGENSTAFRQHSARLKKQARKDGIFSSIDLLQDLVDVQASKPSTSRLSEVNNESNISRIPEVESIVNKLPEVNGESDASRLSEVKSSTNGLAQVNKNIKTSLIDLSKLKLKLNPLISSKLKERVVNKQPHDTEKQPDTSNKVSPRNNPDLNKLSNQHVSDPEHNSFDHVNVAQCHTMDDVKETGPKSCTTDAQHLNGTSTTSDIKETIHQSSFTDVQSQHTNTECGPVLQLSAAKLCNFLKNFHKSANTCMNASIRKPVPVLPFVSSHNETSKTSDQVMSTTSLQIPIELPPPASSLEHNTKVDSPSAIIDDCKLKRRMRRAKQKANQNLINSRVPSTACVKLDTSKEASVIAEDKSKGDDKSVRSVFDCLPALPLDAWEHKSNVN